MCHCINDIEEKIANLGYTNPRIDTRVIINDDHVTGFRATFSHINYAQNNGIGRLEDGVHHIPHNYCPFCGEELRSVK